MQKLEPLNTDDLPIADEPVIDYPKICHGCYQCSFIEELKYQLEICEKRETDGY